MVWTLSGVAPDVGQGFKDFGCNYKDVIFISIDTGSDTQACFDFEEEFTPDVHGLPMVSGYDGAVMQHIRHMVLQVYPQLLPLVLSIRLIQRLILASMAF